MFGHRLDSMGSEVLPCGSVVSVGICPYFAEGFFSEVVTVPPSPESPVGFSLNVPSREQPCPGDERDPNCSGCAGKDALTGQQRHPRASPQPRDCHCHILSSREEESSALPPTAQAALGVTQGFSLPSHLLTSAEGGGHFWMPVEFVA